ncbi:hypothetical protein Bca52824_041384 [Brassica carinata]|uniref:RPN1 N-terminal domain-containing protein n=1 Tax=Brassica carinata TaxID=52824 RepID=A0A8X7RXA9_BRACI|nr:hypothetical protein Bca52824_041384 [Brassica carinata]
MSAEGQRESLGYRLTGSEGDIGSWGHEYVRNLAGEIAEEYTVRQLPQGVEVILDLDEATVKEMRKQEEIAKAKLAMERKKKLAEKAAAKAAIRAQKEAEKKEQKEREKAAKRKTGGSNAYEAISEEVPEASEAEKEEIEAPVEEKPKKEKKVLKEKPIRNRICNRGGPETLPRPMLKRKKQTNYMVWAAPAAVVVLMLLDLGYYYVF